MFCVSLLDQRQIKQGQTGLELHVAQSPVGFAVVQLSEC